MTLTELKKYIVDNDKVPYILECLGCHNIKYHKNKNYVSASNPDGDNKSAVVVYNNENLKCLNFTRNIGENADILTLIGFYLNKDFKQSLKYLHSILGTKPTYKKHKEKEKPDPLRIFTKIKRYRGKKDVEIEAISEDILNDFSPYIHISWFREGIAPWGVEKFGLGYSDKFKRIIIPHRFWLDGSLIGIMGRSTIENCEAFGIKKYMPIWSNGRSLSYEKGVNLYGLWENYETIKQAGYVVVLEGEKSVVKRYCLNDGTGVALCCHSITEEQVRILIGLGVEVVFSMDNDVPEDEVRAMCDKFYGIRKVSYIKDRWGLLGEKDSPADARNRVFNFLFKHRTTYERK